MTKVITSVQSGITNQSISNSAASVIAVAPEHTLGFTNQSSMPLLDVDEFTSGTFGEWIAKGAPDNAQISVSIADVVLDETLQIRKRTYPNTVKKYVDAMQAGKQFPAVRLACIEGTLFLVDGWHRITARSSIGQMEVTAVVRNMTYDEAKWAAGQANLDCGLPLSSSEVREAFNAFMEARMYRQGRRLLSYRAIGAKLGKGHTTIRGWMQKYHPKVFRQYQRIDQDTKYTGNDQADHGNSDKALHAAISQVLQQTRVALDNTKSLNKTLNANARGIIIEKLRETLSELEKLPYQLPMDDEF